MALTPAEKQRRLREPGLAAGSIGRLRRHRCHSQDRNARRPCHTEGPAAAFTGC